MSGRAFVDTNVLVYAFDEAEPTKRARAHQLLDQAEPGELVLSAQVLNEFYVAVTRKLSTPLPASTAAQALRGFAALEVVPLTADLALAGVDRSRRAQLSLWDALIVEAALRGGCQRLWTEDLNAGQQVDGLVVENPFVS